MRIPGTVLLALLPVAVLAVEPPLPKDAAAVALLERARLWDDRNRVQLARETLEKLFRMSPEHPGGLALLARVELHAERPAMARSALERLRKAQPGHPAIPAIEAQLRLGGADRDKLVLARQLAQQARQDGRRELRAKALAAYRVLFPGGQPDGDLALEYWQLVAHDWSDWEIARKGLAELVRQHPDHLRYRLALAEHEVSRLPINRRALQIVIDMTRLPEFERQARATWRRAMQRLDASPENIRLIEDYLQREPNDSVLQDKLKTFAVAEAARRRLLADPSYRSRMEGLALLEKNRPEEAEPLLEAALLGRPDDVELVGGLGLLRLRQGHHTLALALFRQALKLQPDQAGKWSALETAARYWGLLREAGDARSGGDYTLAEDKLTEALAIDSNELQARLVLARVQADRRRPDLAEAGYRKILAQDPVHRAALSELLDLMIREGRRSEAQSLLEGLSPAQRIALGRDLNIIRASLLRSDADGLLVDQRLAEAAFLLEQAIVLDPESAWLRYDLGRVRLARGDLSGAFAPLDELLAKQPEDNAALHALALLQSAAEQGSAALATLERMAPGQRDRTLTRFQRRLWVDMRLQQVRREYSAGRTEQARRLLDDTGRKLGSDDELLPRLARAWGELGEPRRGAHLISLLRASGRPVSNELRLDEAELLADLGETGAVGKIVAELADLSADMLSRTLDIRERAALQRARKQAGEGDRDRALATISSALTEIGDRPGLLREQARLEARRGEPTISARLLRRALELSPDDNGLRMDLANALMTAGQPDIAIAVIGQRLGLGSSPGEESLYDGLRLSRTLLAASGDNAALMLTQVKALRLSGQFAEADQGLRRLLASADNLPPGERAELAEMLLELGWLDSARPLLHDLLRESPDQSRLLLLVGRLKRAEGHEKESLGWLQRGYQRELAERVAQGDIRLSSLTLREGKTVEPVDLEINGPAAGEGVGGPSASRYDLRQFSIGLDADSRWLSAGLDQRSRSGTAGISQYGSTEVAVEGVSPLANGDRWSIRTDAVRLDAGIPDPGSTRHGAMALCGKIAPACAATGAQTASGMGLAVGWQRRDLKVDLGLSPRGFPVENWTGGILDKGDIGPLSWSGELSRRPVTGSLLSWAGSRDPYSGRTWGGVVASGLRIGLSRDMGGRFGAWSSLGLHRLTGRNVTDNNRRQLMAGGYWRAINDDDHLLSIGVTGMYWTHSRNAGEYTFGHGGYYSPAWYRSLALPLTWAQRFARFSYSARYATSRSRSLTTDAPFFPNDSGLQAQADAAGIAAYFTASDPNAATSVGKSLHLAWEYQMSPRLFLGGRIEVERSPDYTPDRMLFYLRYNVDRPAAQPVKLSPEAFLPYSQL